MDVANLVPTAGVVTRRMASAARAPALHFLLLGAAMAFASALTTAPAADPARTIEVSSELLARLVPDSASAPANRAGSAALEAWLDEEVLYREGLRRGMAWNPSAIARMVHVGRFVGAAGQVDGGDGHIDADGGDGHMDADGGDGHGDADALAEVARFGHGANDPVVRAQVAGRMRLQLYGAAMRREPSGDELERYLAEHPERFATPARATFLHVFVRRDRGEAGERMAADLAARLNAAPPDADSAESMGDVFRPGHHFSSLSSREVVALLGEEAARDVMRQPLRRWSDPVRSPYGWHLVWVETRTMQERPALAEARVRVLDAWRREQAGAEVAAELRELRARYRILIDGAVRAETESGSRASS